MDSYSFSSCFSIMCKEVIEAKRTLLGDNICIPTFRRTPPSMWHIGCVFSLDKIEHTERCSLLNIHTQCTYNTPTYTYIHTPLFGKGRVMQSNNNKEETFQLCSQKELTQVPVFTYAAVAAEMGKYWWYSICIALGRDTPVISKNQYYLGISMYQVF